ncbi:MAG: hypothetical protein J0H62_03310, partial [Rhizobiales bacterium]|nr:hypothetical protein [Hyphomicrobiales bacterium]
ESDPPGAEARTSAGQGCRTPCVLMAEGKNDFSVSFAREGYVGQTVRVMVRLPGDQRFDPDAASSVQFDPNPVSVVLDAVPPPPPPKRKPVRKRPPAKRPAAVHAPQSQPAPAASPAQPSIMAPEPAPAPSVPPGQRILPSTIPSTIPPSTSPYPPLPR